MAIPKLEGTFHLDGLVEGAIFSEDNEQFIRSFVQHASAAGVKFHLSIDGGRFSLLADTAPIELPAQAPSAQVVISDALEVLLQNYAPEEIPRLMSTLRSIEYIPGHEIQSLYGIHPRGKISVEQRRIKVPTITPAAPPDWRYRIKEAGILAAVLCVLFGISAFFVPYRDIVRNFVENAKPFRIEQVKIDQADSYARFFQVEAILINKKTKTFEIACKCLTDFPKDEQRLNEMWKSSQDSVGQKLALEALARNYLRCEIYNRQDVFSGQQLCRLHWDKDNQEYFYLVIPFSKDISRIKITY